MHMLPPHRTVVWIVIWIAVEPIPDVRVKSRPYTSMCGCEGIVNIRYHGLKGILERITEYISCASIKTLQPIISVLKERSKSKRHGVYYTGSDCGFPHRRIHLFQSVASSNGAYLLSDQFTRKSSTKGKCRGNCDSYKTASGYGGYGKIYTCTGNGPGGCPLYKAGSKTMPLRRNAFFITVSSCVSAHGGRAGALPPGLRNVYAALGSPSYWIVSGKI